jgi:DNA-binding LacI/PurR family transcriptional regulator
VNVELLEDALDMRPVAAQSRASSRTAARLLVEQIEGAAGRRPRRILFEPALVLRSTLAAPPR